MDKQDDLASYFPMWAKLTKAQQEQLSSVAIKRTVGKNQLIHNGSTDCLGLLVVCSGQLRAYILSEEGREVTIYRLFERDICLFTASCMMKSIQFDIQIATEADTEFFIISADIYKEVMEQSAPLSNYTNEIMASRFSDVMWLIEQIMWKSIDQRLATFLLEETALTQSNTLHITHEIISNHLGTAREVVTRMLRYFQEEGMVLLTRGKIEIKDQIALRALIK